MKDKIIDMFYVLKDKLEEVWWWIQDNVKTTVIGGIFLIGSVVIVMGLLNSNKTDSDKVDYMTQEHLDYLTKNSENMDKMFLNLDEDSDYMMFGAAPNSIVGTDNTLSLNYNLYVRKPFTDSSTIEKTLQEFLDLLKLQTKSEGKTLRMLNVNLYFREALYRENLDPSGTFKYMLDYNKLDIEKLQVDSKYINGSVDDIAQGETNLAKKVKYENYKEYFTYEELKTDKNVVGLTDEEFESYIKLDKYAALGGGYNAGVNLYLRWELGANTSKTSYLNISEQFKSFRQRLIAIGEPSEYFQNSNNLVVLKDKLLVENPQLLYFVDTGIVEKDPTLARKELLDSNSNEYSGSLTRFAEKQGVKFNEYDKIYEPATINFISNMTNSQKIKNGFVDKKGLPLKNIDYDAYFEGKITDKGEEIKEGDTSKKESTEKTTKSTEKESTESSTNKETTTSSTE